MMDSPLRNETTLRSEKTLKTTIWGDLIWDMDKVAFQSLKSAQVTAPALAYPTIEKNINGRYRRGWCGKSEPFWNKNRQNIGRS